jgi:predicted PurR-regulated permease PerM
VTSQPGVKQTDTRISAATDTARLLAVLACVVLLFWLLSDLLLLIFLAVVIAVAISGTSQWAARKTGAPQAAMLALICVAGVALLAAGLYYIGPRLAGETQDLWTQMQQQMGHWQQTYGDTAWGRAIFQQSSPAEMLHDRVATYARSVATSTLGSLVSGFLVIVTALYFAISPDLYVRGAVLLAPLPWRPRVHHVLLHIGRTLRWWLLGQLIDMAVVGVLTGIGLALLGMPLALALAVLAGLFTFIPYFGAIAAAVPAMVVALTVSWQTLVWVLAIFLGCHIIEGYLVSPIVQRRTVHLPPALSILSMAILGTIFGPLGIVVGTPFMAAMLVVVRELYVGGVLGDPDHPGVQAE